MKTENKEEAVIVSLPIDIDKDNLPPINYDPLLEVAISGMAYELRGDGVEVFYQDGNMIVTEAEYLFAFFEDDLEKA